MADEIVLHTCKISRRGKGAKGTVEVKTFGTPILNDDGIAKDFDYSKFRGMKLREVIDTCESLAPKINACEAHVRGYDGMLKSESLQSQSEIAIISALLLEADLAQDSDEAESVARKWHLNRSTAASLGMPVYSYEDLTIARQKVVANLKAQGLWQTRLVDNREEVSLDVPSEPIADNDNDSEVSE